jgi:hypothetical protein
MPRRPPFPPVSEDEIRAEIIRRRAEIANNCRAPTRLIAPATPIADDLEAEIADLEDLLVAKRQGLAGRKAAADQAASDEQELAPIITAPDGPELVPVRLVTDKAVPLSLTHDAVERELTRIRRQAIIESLTRWCRQRPKVPSPDELTAKALEQLDAAITKGTARLGYRHVTTAFLSYAIERARDDGATAVKFADGSRGPVQNTDDLAVYIKQMDNGIEENSRFELYLYDKFPDDPDLSDKASDLKTIRRCKESAIEIIKSGIYDESFFITRDHDFDLSEISNRELIVVAAASFRWDERIVLSGDVFEVPERVAWAMLKAEVARPPTPVEAGGR